jgi:hypothetical protein
MIMLMKKIGIVFFTLFVTLGLVSCFYEEDSSYDYEIEDCLTEGLWTLDKVVTYDGDSRFDYSYTTYPIPTTMRFFYDGTAEIQEPGGRFSGNWHIDYGVLVVDLYDYWGHYSGSYEYSVYSYSPHMLVLSYYSEDEYGSLYLVEEYYGR